ncbi:MAG: carbohydrate binding family 9 domain-containing protein [Gemmatimonadota bacterium]|nr:carbohydrate binding family 9 domain-containing protein [Gemmatimonadota bacterium]
MRLSLVSSFAFVSLSALPSSLSAQTPPAPPPPAAAPDTSQRRVATAVRRTGEISLDGKLDEPAWQSARPTGDFIQSFPKANEKAPDQTEVRILYDDAALYVGMRMFDKNPKEIAAQLARRDASGIYSDWAHLIIDSYHDRRTAFRFTVNPLGVKKDVYTSNDNQEDVNWDAVWDVGVRVDSLGWVAEYRIPLSQLRFGSVSGERVWGLQLQRDVARRQERDTWNPWVPDGRGFVSRFGDLRGLVDIPTPRRLEFVPYASTRVTRAPGNPSNPFFEKTDLRPSAGADLRYGLPRGLTLTATVNPDFGQVEVDPSVVNLSAFETFFPEKRPFFLEGSDVFSFGQIVTHNDYGSQRYFYSRRIGRQPQRFPGGPGVAFFSAPDQTTIAVAAKVTGKNGPWTIGLIDAITPEERADVLSVPGDEPGERFTTPVEPFTNYFAGRVKRDFRKGATVVGGMLTSTVRKVGDAVFENLLRSSATFGGLDFQAANAGRQWVLSGFVAGSHVAGSAESIASTQLNSSHYYQRPDADYVEYDPQRTSLDGHIAEIALAKNGAWYSSLAVKQVSPGLELNDMGFHGRVDYRALSTLYGYQSLTASKRFRNYGYYGYTNHTWNFGGNQIFNALNGGAYVTFLNLWNFGFQGGISPSVESDRFTRGGPLAQMPSSWNFSINGGSDNRKPIWLNGYTEYRRDESGGDSRYLQVTVNMRPASSLSLSLGPVLSGTKSTGQFVRSVSDALATSTYGRRYVFANLNQTTLSMDTRVEWTFTPLLSLQVYAQPFVSAGRYSKFKEFLTPKTYDFAVYGTDRGTIARDAFGTYTVDPDGPDAAPALTFADPNFNVRNLRGNAVLRWEYRPGSALFVVWQQQRSGFEPIGDFDFGRDVGDIFHTVPTNVFLIKATYWIGR